MDDQGHITLSSMGREIAETMYERHTMLSQWLMYLGDVYKRQIQYWQPLSIAVFWMSLNWTGIGS